MPVVVLRSPQDGWREGVRNRFLRQALKALRQADAYIVGTQWLKSELATWLGSDKNIFVVPFGVDRHSTASPPWRASAPPRLAHSGGRVRRAARRQYRRSQERAARDPDRGAAAPADGRVSSTSSGRFSDDQEQLIDRLDLRRAVRSVASADETALRAPIARPTCYCFLLYMKASASRARGVCVRAAGRDVGAEG